MEYRLIEKELVEAIIYLNEQYAVGTVEIKVVQARSGV